MNFKIRPAARIIRTIGHDLIKDVHAAIVELVKNSYDADSPDSKIVFSYKSDINQLEIVIIDSGHGMSFDTVVNKWLVPATEDKLERKTSPEGRILQGRKGIGRFAAAILGDVINLVTTDMEGVTTTLNLDMSVFDKKNTFLHDIEIPVTHKQTNNNSGTKITITSNNIFEKNIKETWNPKRLEKLLLELKKLLSPAELINITKKLKFSTKEDNFDIVVEFKNFPNDKYSNKIFKIEPYPVIELFDYRIYGFVDNKGNATLTYENQNIPSIKPLIIKKEINLLDSENESYPGKVYVDLRVYDRDSEAIDNMISRGLNDPDTKKPVGKREARKILDDFYGIGIYRGKFKIRPYGDKDYDWLDLDKQRVQNPSFKIGHNQVIGFINIQTEDESNLIEKSARDGLIENSYYYGLILLVGSIVRLLEDKRFEYREKTLKGRTSKSADEMIKGIFEFKKMENSINREIKKARLPKGAEEKIVSIIKKSLGEESHKKSKELDDLREKIAIYQGQVTLGKITHVLLHDGRKHIKYIMETTPRLTRWMQSILDSYKEDLYVKIIDRSNKVVISAKSLSYLFKKVEPLAIARRPPKKYHSLNKVLFDTASFFDVELREKNISFENKIPDELSVEASQFDLSTILLNLFENSIYWLTTSIKNNDNKKIIVDTFVYNKKLFMHYSDNGPGFQGANLELMFEPGYSMKPGGTGLGLSLAGEAISRIGGSISAQKSEKGALFEISFNNYKEGKSG